ncbi:MAG: hypothetical protein Q9205_002940 [Flavoplaca limonia]
MSVPQNELPTRLIDVGSLCKPMSCRFHKWGGASILKLTKSTFESMQHGIDINDLPLTFQHAIIITQNLGYRYVWIDSLCIIQDDPDDWAFQSSTMSRVYSNSVLTIAALWGDDSHSGCFVERNPLVTEGCRIGTWKHGKVIVESGDRKRVWPLRSVKPAPLLKRAWVLQERFLSPRTLFYGPWELYWECGERATDESHPKNTSKWLRDTLKIRFRSMKETGRISRKPLPLARLWHHIRTDLRGIAHNDSIQNTQLDSNYDLWTKIRSEYWSSNLTYHSDTLVAISGVTDVIEQKTGLHFVFGLCKEFLCSELLWEVENADATVRSTLGPTWSWASVEKAQLRSAYYEGRYETTNSQTWWTGSVSDSKGRDPTLNSKDLHLRGPLSHATLKRDDDGHFMTDNDRLPKYGYRPDIYLPDTVDVVCLFVVTWTVDVPHPPGSYRGQIGLILVPSPREDSTYERVGLWERDTYSHPMDSNIMGKRIRSFRLT